MLSARLLITNYIITYRKKTPFDAQENRHSLSHPTPAEFIQIVSQKPKNFNEGNRMMKVRTEGQHAILVYILHILLLYVSIFIDNWWIIIR